MIQTVVKRDGRIVGFNEQKLMAAIRKAMLHTDKGEDTTLIEQITDPVSYTHLRDSTKVIFLLFSKLSITFSKPV